MPAAHRSRSGVRVLIVCAIDTTAWILLRPQLRAMQAKGWAVAIACSDGDYRVRLAAEGFEMFPVAISRSYSPLAHLGATYRLYRLMLAEKFQIVHVHTPVAALIGRLAAFLARVPVVLYTAHGFYFHEHMPIRTRYVHVLLERLAGRVTHFLFTQSSEDAQTAVAERIAPSSRIQIIGNGVAVDEFSTVTADRSAAWRRKLGLQPEHIVIGTLGRLVAEKGYREFFEAGAAVCAEHPSAILLVVGGAVEGDRDPFVTEMATLISSDVRLKGKVIFTGFAEDVPELMSLVDIFVLASYREGMPRSVIEAMAAGKPVVASNIRGCREEVVDGVTGFLVPVHDSEALARSMSQLVGDPSLRQAFGRNGQARARSEFDEKDVINRLLTTVESLLPAPISGRALI